MGYLSNCNLLAQPARHFHQRFFICKEKIMDEFIYDEEETNVIEEPHSIWSMARIGEFVSGASFVINVYSGEDPIPHFHIKNTQTNEEGCIRIDCAKYFSHGVKIMKLNNKQKKHLMEYLSTPSEYEEDYGKTPYELIWEEWNRNNRSYRIPKPVSMPDYMRLKD